MPLPQRTARRAPTTRPATEAAAWLADLLAVTIPAAIARYRHTAGT
jgi:hypothetical protein